jgi:dihydrolipoamide dehydrogenase
MPDTHHFQVAVIGAGPGGYVSAIRAAQLGARTVVVEKDELGGTCLNWGCIPTKAWITSAHLYELIRRAKEFGIEVGEPRLNWQWLLERKRKIVSTLVNGVKQQLGGREVAILRGRARLTAPHRFVVQLKEGGAEEYSADHIILATGAEATLPPGFRLDGERVITSQEALELSRQPARLVVLGGGVVGCEFASFFAAIGTQVTVVEMLPRLVPAEDDEVAQALERELRKQKIALHLSTKVEALAERPDGSLALTLTGGGMVETDTVLVATGRRPYTGGLGLDSLGVALGERGRIVVNERLETSVEGVYAIGDVTDIKQLAHFASAQGKAAAETATGHPAQTNWRAVPAATFTSPEIASVGLTEREAVAAGRTVKLGKFPFRILGKAIADGETAGFVKIVSDASTDQVLGVHIIGPRASELIHEAALAVAADLNAHDLAQAIHAHPTLSEAMGEAAEDVAGIAIHLLKPLARPAPRA